MNYFSFYVKDTAMSECRFLKWSINLIYIYELKKMHNGHISGTGKEFNNDKIEGVAFILKKWSKTNMIYSKNFFSILYFEKCF